MTFGEAERGNDEGRSRQEERALALEVGQVVRSVHLALAAAGEPAPEFEYLTPSVSPAGTVFVRLAVAPEGRRGPDELGPHDRLYALLDDGSGVYERTCPGPGAGTHRRVGFDGTVEAMGGSPFSPGPD